MKKLAKDSNNRYKFSSGKRIMSINHLIKILPFPVKQSIKYIYGIIPPRIRYGKVFWDTYNFLQESQWWSREKLEDYQLQQLRELLHHAYENVPYYRRIFDERGLKSKDIHNFDDLRKLPYFKHRCDRYCLFFWHEA